MGVCGSKSAGSSAPARNLSNWRVEEPQPQPPSSNNAGTSRAGTSPTNANRGTDSRGIPTTAGGHVHVSVSASDLALNCVATHARYAATQTCLTGWEDGSIRQLCWLPSSTDTSHANTVVDVWKPHNRAVNRIIIGQSGQLLYSCSRDTTVGLTPCSNSNNNNNSVVVPTADKPSSTLLRGHSLNVATIAVDATDTTLCSGGRDTQTIFWDVATGAPKVKATTPQNVVTCSTWLPQSDALVVQGSEDLTLKVWDARTSLRAPAQVFRGFVYFALSLDVSPDATYVLTSSKGFSGVGCEVRVWDRRMATMLVEYRGHQQDATACCFLPPSASSSRESADVREPLTATLPLAVSASKDGSVKLWDATTTRVRCDALAPAGSMFTGLCAVDDTTLLASTFDGAVHAFYVDASASQLTRIEH